MRTNTASEHGTGTCRACDRPRLFVHVKGRRGLGHLCRQTAILRRLRHHLPGARVRLRLKTADTLILEPSEFDVSVSPDGTDDSLPRELVDYDPDYTLFDTVFPSVAPPDAGAFSRPPSGILTLRHIRPERFSELEASPWMSWVRLVLVPHERTEDVPLPSFSPTVDVRYVGPVLLERPLVDRNALLARYGITPRDPLIVATVGGGGYASFAESFVDQVLAAHERLAEDVPGVRLVLIAGPHAPARATSGNGVLVQAVEPELPTLFNAADVVVTHGGYNSSHEILNARTPAVFIPNAAKWDDTLRRARRFERANFGLLGAPDPGGLARQLAMLLDPRDETTRRIRRSLASRRSVNGADAAARLLRQHVRCCAGRNGV